MDGELEILIVTQTGDGTASIEPAEFQSANKEAVMGFVRGFNRGELEDCKGAWAVIRKRGGIKVESKG